MRCKQKRSRRYFNYRKLWRKINLLSEVIQIQNLLTFIIMIIEVSNKHHGKLYKILRNFCFEHNLCFSVVLDNYASISGVPVIIHKWSFVSFLTLVYGNPLLWKSCGFLDKRIRINTFFFFQKLDAVLSTVFVRNFKNSLVPCILSEKFLNSSIFVVSVCKNSFLVCVKGISYKKFVVCNNFAENSQHSEKVIALNSSKCSASTRWKKSNLIATVGLFCSEHRLISKIGFDNY